MVLKRCCPGVADMSGNPLESSLNTSVYERLIRPLLFKMDPERAHRLVNSLVPQMWWLGPALKLSCHYENKVLKTEFAGHTFHNPIGLAAGFDKNATMGPLLDTLGFGFVEIGSISGRPCTGFPTPRLFRLVDDQALINRMGLNNHGAKTIAARIKAKAWKTPLGVNVVKTNDPSIVGDLAVEDLLISFLAIRDLPLAYITINASCPNTHAGIAKETNEIEIAISEMQRQNRKKIPILLKLSPDASDQLLNRIMEVGSALEVAGYVCGNSSTSRSNLKTSIARLAQIGNGGLTGPPLRELAYQLCQRVARLKNPNQSLIACGGITSGEDAYRFLEAGAAAVQLYTAMVYQGPGLPALMKRQLAAILESKGTCVLDLINRNQAQLIGR